MSRASPQTQELARCLIAYEATNNKTAAEAAPAAGAKVPGGFRVCERLRPHLATYLGRVGFRALLSRALVLAAAEAPWLRLVEVKADGALQGFDKLAAQVDPEEIVGGGVALVVQVLSLLTAFIGETLTLQVVREVWSEMSLGGFNPDQEDPP